MLMDDTATKVRGFEKTPHTFFRVFYIVCPCVCFVHCPLFLSYFLHFDVLIWN